MINDKEWLQTVLDSVETPGLEIGGITLPGFPDPEYSDLTITNGMSEPMLKGAFKLYNHVKQSSLKYGRPLDSDSHVLDFGCGWGRIARFFLREVKRENFYGVDVVPKLVEICEETFQSDNFSTIEQKGTLPFANGTFDVVFANSVFSHLEPDLNMAWMKEIHRTLQPNGMAMLTIIDPDKFVTMAKGAKEWMEKLELDVTKTQTELEKSGFVWRTTHRQGELTGYGLAVITLDWIKENWGQEFELLEAIEDYSQTVLVLKKR